MEDSAIKYFFSADGSDKRGCQFAQALSVGKLGELVQVKNFVEDPRIVNRGLFDNDVHPEVVQFLVLVGQYHSQVFSVGAPSLAQLDASPVGTPGKALWENVVKVFGSIGDLSVRKFFSDYVNVVVATPAGDQPVELEVFQPSMVDLSNVRMNLKKDVHGAVTSETRFSLALPNTPFAAISSFGIQIAPTAPYALDSLKRAHMFGYMGHATVNPAQLLGNKAIGFTVDLREFIKSALAKVKNVADDGSDLPESSILDFTTGDIISVKDGKFVKKEGSLSVPIDMARESCYSTQFKGPAIECQKLISDLIFNEDSDAFNKYFARFDDSWFAVKARDEIAKVHPDMAVKILKKFGFGLINVPTGGRNLQKFESLYSWMQKLNTMNLAPATLDNIRKASHLKTYLELLVNYVNNNPVILNSGISAVDPHVEPEEVDPQSYLGRTKITMLPRIPLGEQVGDKDRHDALLKVATNMSMAHRLLSVPASLPFPFPVMRLPGMVGGAVGGSATLKPIVRGLIADLGRKGKKLRPADQQLIENHLDTLDKLEKSLVKVSQQLSEYKDWVSIFPGQSQTVSLGSIEGSIDKYRECVAQHANLELGLINVALKLCEQ